MDQVWKNCSSCKKPINYGQKHYICSVSTCQSTRFFPRFCTLGCWDAHVATMNHRSAWAEERFAPKEAPVSARLPAGGGDSDELRARLMRQMKSESTAKETKDILIVASKLKKYIVRFHANDAIDRAREDGRKTVKGRDFKS